MKRYSVKVTAGEDRIFVVRHDRRSHYAIQKKVPRTVSETGWTKLGEILRYCEPRGCGLRWCDLGGTESANVFRSLRACLIAFIEEMDRRAMRSQIEEKP